MKLRSLISKQILAASLAVGLFTPPLQAAQNDDQIAIQLGAIVLNVDLATATTAEQAQALVQGRAILKSKTGRAAVGVVPVDPDVQSETLRDQILTATELALTNPQNLSIDQTVVLFTNKAIRVRATLDPKRTTASAIVGYTLKRIPNFGPTLVGTAISQALTSSNGTFLFNYKTETAALKDANKAAGLSMRSALKAYARGTVNWAGVPSAGVGNGTFLPNFSAKNLPARTTGISQAPNPAGVANAAGAVAATAARALDGATLTSPKSTAFRALGIALVKAAAASQKISSTTGAGSTPLRGGSVAGTGFGAVVTIADGSVVDWNAQGDLNILNAIVAGGIAGSKANAYSFAIGVTQGFASAYLNSPGIKVDADSFKALNSSAIAQQFFVNGVKTGRNFEGIRNKSLVVVISEAIDALYAAHSANDYSIIAGGDGLQLPGTPTPVTDTVGL